MSNIPVPPPPGAPGYQSVSTPTGQFHGVQYGDRAKFADTYCVIYRLVIV
jgi:hypothetical protein